MRKITGMLTVLLFMFTTLVWAGGEHDAKGKVNSVDKSSKTINISHEPISSMGMSAMTMDFRVADPAMLDDVKSGQKIEFVVTTDKKGRFVIVDMQ